MRLACIVLAHRGPEQLAALLAALRHPRVSIYLHLDRRARLKPYTRAFAAAGVPDITMLPRRVGRWGGLEIVDAALSGLENGMRDGCGYHMLTSGQDFPLRPIDQIIAFAEQAGSRSYVDHFALPTQGWRFEGRDRTEFYTYTVRGRRETCIPRGQDVSGLSLKGQTLNALLRLRTSVKPSRRFPTYVRAFGGSQWWNLSGTAAAHVLKFLSDHPDYHRYHRYTLLPDEIFFQSILLGTEYSKRYEVVNDAARYAVWPTGASHPRILTTADVPAMMRSGKLFGRKFDATVDAAVLDEIPRRWLNEPGRS